MSPKQCRIFTTLCLNNKYWTQTTKVEEGQRRAHERVIWMLCVEREKYNRGWKVWVEVSRKNKTVIFFADFTVFDSRVIFHRAAGRDSAAARLLKVSVSFSAVTFLQLTDKICGISPSRYRSAWFHCHLCKLLQGHEPIDPRRWGRISAGRNTVSHSVFLTPENRNKKTKSRKLMFYFKLGLTKLEPVRLREGKVHEEVSWG